MKQRSYPGGVAVFMALIIAMLPVAFADSISLTYDLNGNLVTGDGVYREYNSLNQLWKVYNGSSDTGVLLQTYVYHPVEERVLIKQLYNDSGEVYETIYYVNDNLVRTVNSTGTYDTVYVKHGGQLVAEVKPDSSVVYYHPDHLGSTSLTTDSSGDALENTYYTPYGVILSGGEQSKFDYEGKEYDDITGARDFHFRMQGIAGTPVFQQPDTVLQNVFDPQTLNRYAFERNSPYNRIDPDGHIAPLVAAGIAIFSIGFVVGVVSEGISQIDSGQFNAGTLLASGVQSGGIALGAAFAISLVTTVSPALGIAASIGYEAYDLLDTGEKVTEFNGKIVYGELTDEEKKQLSVPEADLKKIKSPAGITDTNSVPTAQQQASVEKQISSGGSSVSGCTACKSILSRFRSKSTISTSSSSTSSSSTSSSST